MREYFVDHPEAQSSANALPDPIRDGIFPPGYTWHPEHGDHDYKLQKLGDSIGEEKGKLRVELFAAEKDYDAPKKNMGSEKQVIK